MVVPLDILLGILLIMMGIYLPFYVYRSFREKVRYRIFFVTICVAFGLILLAIGVYLLFHA